MTNGGDTLEVVPVRHVGRWVGGALVVLVTAMVIHTLFSRIPTGQVACHTVAGVKRCHAVVNWRFQWNIVNQYFFSRELMIGLWRTILITVVSMVIGITIGVLIAVMRVSGSRLLSSVAWVYTWFFRGTPVYVQVLFWFAIASIFPEISLGIPFAPVFFLHINMVNSFTPMEAGIVALSLNEGAYMAEIARAGLLSVDEGQTEAAHALGMSRGQTLRLVVLPQAMRVILPPTGNEVISMLKTSSLVASISVLELLGMAQSIAAQNYQPIGMLITASLWYLIVTTFLSIGQFYVERHFSKGATRNPPPTPLQRLRHDLRGILAKARPTRGVVATGAQP
jgi:polar amino acid transport system permease protein